MTPLDAAVRAAGEGVTGAGEVVVSQERIEHANARHPSLRDVRLDARKVGRELVAHLVASTRTLISHAAFDAIGAASRGRVRRPGGGRRDRATD